MGILIKLNMPYNVSYYEILKLACNVRNIFSVYLICGMNLSHNWIGKLVLTFAMAAMV